jgi:tRNA isopentenyl-2-thiomethyl-A-37 hydroxylase MiaE
MPSAQLHVKLQDPSLWVDKALIDGKLVEARSGKRFNVEGEYRIN